MNAPFGQQVSAIPPVAAAPSPQGIGTRIPAIPAAFFGIVLGLAGLGNVWRAATAAWQLPAVIGEALMAAATLVWLTLLVLYGVKWIARRNEAVAEALHPVQCCFIGLGGVSTMLISLAVLPYHRPAGFVLFLAGGTVFDTVGGAVLDASFHAIRRFGHVVSALGWGTHALAPLSFKSASYSGVFTLLPLLTGEGREHHGAILREAARLVDAGTLVPRLDPRHFDLTTAAEAHAAVAGGNAAGKVVVSIG